MGFLGERTWLLLAEMRSMLHDQGLPFFLWAEACNTSFYIQNMSPHIVLESKTLEEDFIGEKP